MNDKFLKIHQKLIAKAEELKNTSINDLFSKDPERAERFILSIDNALAYDFSRERIDQEAIDLLLELYHCQDCPSKLDDLFSGEHVNHSEDRPALHTLLRDAFDKNISDSLSEKRNLVANELEKLKAFTEAFSGGKILGVNGKPLNEILVIGIGGSYLGNKLLHESLGDSLNNFKLSFLTEPNDKEFESVTSDLNLEETLVIIISKSFTTKETLMIGNRIKEKLQNTLGEDVIKHQFVGISSNAEGLDAFGIPKDRQFYFWEWVGGRYSIWSSVGLPISLVLGYEAFESFLEGGSVLDKNIQSKEPFNALPVMHALIGFWNQHYLDKNTHLVLTYPKEIKSIVEYNQQLVMESNGKGLPENSPYKSSVQIIWGGSGVESQHSFYQGLHQSNLPSSIEFVSSFVDSDFNFFNFSNLVAQLQTLTDGNRLNEDRKIIGDKAHSLILLSQISPFNIGAYLALQEHSTYIKSLILGINAFDQFGVETGKVIADNFLKDKKVNISEKFKNLDFFKKSH
jgi:glucose-6-phosphate isomerase